MQLRKGLAESTNQYLLYCVACIKGRKNLFHNIRSIDKTFLIDKNLHWLV